ncbi:MAG: chromosomal replication initiator protein DnaA [Capsulimonadales bacterium]|nr:chromosomal replication initiator protein DnaA [Capsulimonadales bacterium]
MSDQLRFEDEEVNITLRRAWDRALRTLSSRVNKPTFETHIRSIRPMALAERVDAGKNIYLITLGVPSAFTREWVEKRHASLIAGILEEIFDRDVRLEFVLSPREKPASDGRGKTPFPALFGEDTDLSGGGAPSPVPSPTPPAPGKAATPPVLTADEEFALAPAPERPLTVRTPRSVPTPERHGTVRKSTADTAADRETAIAPSRGVPARSGANSAGYADAPLLNPRYTFDNFVVGASNRLAHAGARAVAEAPGAVYNPLFLYGPPGLGKTHLMHAIGNEIVLQHGIESHRIAYLSGEAFASSFITSLREHRTDDFRRRWRSMDLFLVDDIQFIAGKEHTKEEFFHTFNALYQMGKQIVISSDRSPRELRMMDERLRSRFECGLTADITPPDLETRLAILQRKAEIERMRISDEVLLYMAKLVQSNIRTLEGALVKIIAYASLQNSPVTTELAASVLEHYYISAGIGDAIAAEAKNGNHGANGWPVPPTDRSNDRPSGAVRSSVGSPSSASFGVGLAGLRGSVTPEVVQRVVCRRFGLDPDALIGKRRDREIVVARQIAMHLMRELTETSLPGIGQLFGGRDHSTVLHACDKVRSSIPLDDDLRSLVEDLTVQIRAQAAG